MDPFDQLLDLRQESSSIEECITQFCELSYRIPFDNVVLKYLFHFGLSEPIKSWLRAGKFNCSLKDFMDYTLLCAGSLFTVGVADEDRDTASMTKMVAVPERTHKMVAPATGHIITAIHESSQVTLNRHASSRITADLHESRKSHSFSLCTHCLIESNQLTVDHHVSSQVMDNLRESNQVTRRAVPELSSCPVTAKEAVCESPSRLPHLLRPRGVSCSVCSSVEIFCLLCLTLVDSCSAMEVFCPVCSTLVGSSPVCSALVPCSAGFAECYAIYDRIVPQLIVSFF